MTWQCNIWYDIYALYNMALLDIWQCVVLINKCPSYDMICLIWCKKQWCKMIQLLGSILCFIIWHELSKNTSVLSCCDNAWYDMMTCEYKTFRSDTSTRNQIWIMHRSLKEIPLQTASIMSSQVPRIVLLVMELIRKKRAMLAFFITPTLDS